MLRQIGLLTSLSVVALTGCGTPSTTTVKADAAKPLSAVFQGQCASCHGPQGLGDFGPNLTKLDFVTFKSTVRAGKGDMPMFDTATYTDADLSADYTILTGKPAQ